MAVSHPTYVGCSVAEPWRRLSGFWEWAEPRWSPGLQLDKDILVPGNRVYGPETCCFVSQALNNLVKVPRAKRGTLPAGVVVRRGLFQARCWVGGKRKNLGSFGSPEEAHAVYVEFKVGQIREASGEQDDARIATGLERHARLLEASVFAQPLPDGLRVQ
jgi:hypothetical protein